MAKFRICLDLVSVKPVQVDPYCDVPYSDQRYAQARRNVFM